MQIPLHAPLLSDHLPPAPCDTEAQLRALLPAHDRKAYLHPFVLQTWHTWARMSRGLPAPIAAEVVLIPPGSVRVLWARDMARLHVVFSGSEVCSLSFSGHCTLMQAFACLLTEIGEKTIEEIPLGS